MFFSTDNTDINQLDVEQLYLIVYYSLTMELILSPLSNMIATS